jgi:hypothetical protein
VSARSPLTRLDRWLMAPVPRDRLIALRVLIAGFAAVYVAARLPVLWRIGDRPASTFSPVGVLSVLEGPPAIWIGRLLPVCVIGCSLAALSGRCWRFWGPAWAFGLLLLSTWRSSWGQVIHHEHLLVLHALVLAASPAGSCGAGSVGAHPPAVGRLNEGEALVAGWWVRLLSLATVATYVLAGLAKVRLGGSEWLDGEILQHHLARNVLRLDLLGASGSPFADELAARSGLLAVVSPIVVILEVGSPALLLGRVVRNVWVALLWSMHVGIALFLWITFPYQLLLFAFLPLYAVERLPGFRRPTGPLRWAGIAATAQPSPSAVS